MMTANDPKLQRYLEAARSDCERAELLAHATVPGTCDAEYCPWRYMQENLCIREELHTPNCRCPDCCAEDDWE